MSQPTGVKPPPLNLGDLRLRVISAVIMAVAAGIAAWLGCGLFLLCWVFLGSMVALEWQQIVASQSQIYRTTVSILVIVLCAMLSSHGSGVEALQLAAVGALLVASLAETKRRIWAGIGVLYAAGMVIAVCALRFTDSPYGMLAIFWLFAVVWGTDVMAYFGGRLIGGPKLWPRISPSKTWSGTLVGIASGALLGLFLCWLAGKAGAPGFVLGLGLILAIGAQMGDLFESAIKRRFGVKDSSPLIPGHGGFMDRLDGFIFASILALMIGAMRYDIRLAAAGLFQW
ncbi:MAG: CDP-archaeol synthase [Hyphomicrobiales bacterium]|nr:CDP-archaeol synthase [Hyphomicrobiales bacterium]